MSLQFDSFGRNLNLHEPLVARTLRNEIQDLIDHENKQKLLSDEAIPAASQEKGIFCAGRNVAKYRYRMNLGDALQREKYGGDKSALSLPLDQPDQPSSE